MTAVDARLSNLAQLVYVESHDSIDLKAQAATSGEGGPSDDKTTQKTSDIPGALTCIERNN